MEQLRIKLSVCGNDPIKFVAPSGHDRIGIGIWSLKSDTAGRTMLLWYIYAKGADFVAKDGFYGDYMKDILQKKLKS